MENNIVAVIQARMGASRLSGKMLMPLKGKPIIEWVCRRVSRARNIDKVVVSIPEGKKDCMLAGFLVRLGMNVFRGSENDVVDRFFQSAKELNATHVVRVCADNPFICPEMIDLLAEFYFANECDYAYNHIPRNNQFPDGLGAEIVSFNILEKIHKEAKEDAQREHVFNYIWDNHDKFVIKTFDPDNEVLRHPGISLDVDTIDDLHKLEGLDASIEMSGEEILFRNMGILNP